VYKSISNRISQLLKWSFFRYLLTGVGLFLLDLAIFLACVTIVGLDVRIGQIISRTVGATVGFFGHKYYSFRSEREHSLSLLALQGSGYTLITILNILLSPIILYVVIRMTQGDLISAKIISEIILVSQTYVLLRILFLASRYKDAKRKNLSGDPSIQRSAYSGKSS
jgi:putative flippase GtrA